MPQDFTGKVAIVTGAASGIGTAIARQLATGGAKVVVADLALARAETVVQEIAAAGGTAAAFEINVADAIEVSAMVDFAVKRFGGLHLAVNNAGIGGPAAPVADYPLEGWHQVLNVNLNGAFYGLKYQIPAIIASGARSARSCGAIRVAPASETSEVWVAEPFLRTRSAIRSVSAKISVA